MPHVVYLDEVIRRHVNPTEERMALSDHDRHFLQTANRFKLYLVLLAVAVLIFVVTSPREDLRLSTAVFAVALCGLFWLTSKLLTYITTLDREVSELSATIGRDK